MVTTNVFNGSASGRGGAGGGLLRGALVGFGLGFDFGLLFGDEREVVVGRRKAVSGELGVAVGTALGEDFVEAVGGDDFDRGLVARRECFLLID